MNRPPFPKTLTRAAAFAALATCALGAQLPAPGTPAGLDVAGMDRAVAPGDDFFAYANGTWLATHEIPPDRSSWGAGAVVDELTVTRTAEVIRAAGHAPGSDAARVGTYFTAYMDEAGIESAGLRPLAPGLAAIDAIKDRRDLARALGATLRADVDVLNNTNLHTESLFGLWVAQDLNNPAHYLPFLLQGGLVMPDRDYYLNPSQKMVDIRARYQAHIEAMLGLAQLPGAKTRAVAIFALETRIAQAHWSREESEQVSKGNNHWKAADFARQAPGLDWSTFLGTAGLGHQEEFIVWQPSAVTGISALTASEPLEAWKDFLRFHLIAR